MRKLIMTVVSVMLGASLMACGDSHAGMHCQQAHNVTVMMPIYHTWTSYTSVTSRAGGRMRTTRVRHTHHDVIGWYPLTHTHCDVWVANTPAPTHS